MNDINKLRDVLMELEGDSLRSALFIVVDCMMDAGPGGSHISDGDIGISFNDKCISIVNIAESRPIADIEIAVY